MAPGAPFQALPGRAMEWVLVMGSSVVGAQVRGEGGQAWPCGKAGSAGLGPALGSAVLTT